MDNYMHKFGKYAASDSMNGLVGDDHRVLLVMSRFGIGLGFGDKSIGEVCAQSAVDTDTFLAVVNLLSTDNAASRPGKVSLEALLAYLKNSHDYFLGFRLPAIRARLAAAVGESDDLSKAIVRYFDQYIAGVRKHMEYEEKTVFPYVRALLSGAAPEGNYTIGIFRRQHDHVEARLDEFKGIFIKYYAAPSTNEINGILFDVINCAQDLAWHNAVEDSIFVPAIEALEHKTGQRL